MQILYFDSLDQKSHGLMLPSKANIQPKLIFFNCWPEHSTAKNYCQGKVQLHCRRERSSRKGIKIVTPTNSPTAISQSAENKEEEACLLQATAEKYIVFAVFRKKLADHFHDWNVF